MKKRLDVHLHEQGYLESRSLARAAVMEGRVKVDGSTSVKPGTQVTGGESIEVMSGGCPYVSRGGLKLAGALEAFGVDVTGKTALDVGSSTGGFTDCLLQKGALRVIAVDVGRGLLHWKLRGDPRVLVIEGQNARCLDGVVDCAVDMATVDVSFISLSLILEPVFGILGEGGVAIALVKPQFEAGREHVEKGGVVREPNVHLQVLRDLRSWLERHRISLRDAVHSPLKGPKGNMEFLMYLERWSAGGLSDERLGEVVERAHSELGRGFKRPEPDRERN
jgi:23S rRNA (cytidine1920-2'-O)/16S rRNA (cytidine1409-2'-O)-methyltransferase